LSIVKSFWSVKGILVVLILALVTLSSGTALAGRQSAVSPQASLERLDAATIVPSSLCTEVDTELSVWGSGWGSGELILLSLIRDADDAWIWYSGAVNPAGAFEVNMNVVAKTPKTPGNKVLFPGAGLFTLEALGTSGRMATTPLLFTEDKCSGS